MSAAFQNGPGGRPARRVGRPRMSEVPELRERNLFWLALHQLYGLSVEQIAARDRVGASTVRAGIRDAESYRPDRDDDDQAERIVTLSEARGRRLQTAGY